jgi:hypothetical protein
VERRAKESLERGKESFEGKASMSLSATYNNNIRLPRWAADIIANPPRSGQGFHFWLFRAACALWKCGRKEREIAAILENAATTCGRRVTTREVEDAVRNSERSAFQFARSRQSPWPSLNTEQREAVIASRLGLVDLWEFSPIRLDHNEPRTEEIIDALFPGNPLLCGGQSSHEFTTRSRSEWRGELTTLQLIVPSPMTARIGHTQDGKESAHALSITGSRRFLVIEQDAGPVDEQAAVLLHLADRAPLAVAVHSGSKSIHGWFYCTGQAEEKLRRFMQYAVSLGADTATWTRSQFVRMPDGVRDNGKRQAVYFFNPGVLK